MDDYFHLNRKKSEPQAAREDAARDPKDTEPTEDVTNLELEGEASDDLELVEPPRPVENTDPYNSTGRFNIKNVKW